MIDAAKRSPLLSIHGRVGTSNTQSLNADCLITNRRRPIMVLEEDTSPGRHDTLIAACDDYRYGLLGCEEYHDNCTDNLQAAMRRIGVAVTECPSPLNLWMNIPVAEDGSTSWAEPLSKPGDHVVLRAQMDCIVAMSACPQDILPIMVRHARRPRRTTASCQPMAEPPAAGAVGKVH